MSDRESRDHLAAEEVAHLLELTEIAVQAEDLEGLAQGMLPLLMRVMEVTGAILCLEEPRPPFHSLFSEGIQAGALPLIKKICIEQFQQNPLQEDPRHLIIPLSPQESSHLVLFALGGQTKPLGFFGLILPVPDQLPRPIFLRKMTTLLA